MFRSVSKKMLIFCVSYIWVVIGFMMMLTILFSWKRHLNIKRFPGTIVSVLVMMLGEIEFLELQYPEDLVIKNRTKIEEEPVASQFPITAHVALLLFILVFCLVIMNLLVGIAVSDINKLMKTSKVDQLVDQVELACSVLNFRKTATFKYLPKKFQDKFIRLLIVLRASQNNFCLILGCWMPDGRMDAKFNLQTQQTRVFLKITRICFMISVSSKF